MNTTRRRAAKQPEQLVLSQLGAGRRRATQDVVVDIEWSGISTGTEKLLWTGRMPPLPGHGLSAGAGLRIGRPRGRGRRAGSACSVGERVFVPGADCFGDVRGLFGGAAARARGAGQARGRGRRSAGRATPSCWRWPPPPTTRCPAAACATRSPPDLIVGHGVLGRLLARIDVAAGAPTPVVWERNPRARARRRWATASSHPDEDPRRDYRAIYDVSGDAVDPRHADRPAGAGRRDRAGRLLQRAAVLRLPAGLHARGADPRRRRMAARRTCWP